VLRCCHAVPPCRTHAQPPQTRWSSRPVRNRSRCARRVAVPATICHARPSRQNAAACACGRAKCRALPCGRRLRRTRYAETPATAGEGIVVAREARHTKPRARPKSLPVVVPWRAGPADAFRQSSCRPPPSSRPPACSRKECRKAMRSRQCRRACKRRDGRYSTAKRRTQKQQPVAPSRGVVITRSSSSQNAAIFIPCSDQNRECHRHSSR